jgi:formylglycine-generating enzyme required for sulfatase activity
MTENALPKDEYYAALDRASLLAEQVEDAEPAQREEIQAEIHRLIARTVDDALTEEEKLFRDDFINDIYMIIPTRLFVYPAAKALVQQAKRDIRSQPYEFESNIFDGENIHQISHQGRCFTENLGKDIVLEMVYIPSGSFLMGDLPEEYYKCCMPQHSVTVLAFSIGKFAITQAEWLAVMDHNPSANLGSDRLPVDNVSWDDTTEFCQRLSRSTGRKYRLPSEAEWEYTCRAGTTTAYSWGNEIDRRFANYFDFDSQAEWGTKPVGSYDPNVFGLYDMHGNVFEFCQDRWHCNYENAPTDGSAWIEAEQLDQIVIRGGSFDYYEDNCRSSYRTDTCRDYRYQGTGFRVACDAIPSDFCNE